MPYDPQFEILFDVSIRDPLFYALTPNAAQKSDEKFGGYVVTIGVP